MIRPNAYPYIYSKRKYPLKTINEHIIFKINKTSDFLLKFISVNWPIEAGNINSTPDLSFDLRDKSNGKTFNDVPVNFSQFTTPGKGPVLSGTNIIDWLFWPDSPLELIITGQSPGTPFNPQYINIAIFGMHKERR